MNGGWSTVASGCETGEGTDMQGERTADGPSPAPDAARDERRGDLRGDASLAALLRSARTIAVVGIKDREHEDAFRIPQYLQRAGYSILPVNPKLGSVLGEPCRASLAQVDRPIDIVNLFRASEHVPAHVDEILALDPRPKAVWMQLGIHHGPSAQRLRDAGIEVVQDRCIMVDHRRLIGAPPAP
jgi:predicted CoA-binding protein